jgi:hypothetical protein
MTVPGVGPIVALTYRAAIDQPHRFVHSRAVGAHAGLTPKRYQSGEIDYDGKISKAGDAMLRPTLYEAALTMLTASKKWSWLMDGVDAKTLGRVMGAPSAPDSSGFLPAHERSLIHACLRVAQHWRTKNHPIDRGRIYHSVNTAIIHQIGLLKSAFASQNIVSRHHHGSIRDRESVRLRRDYPICYDCGPEPEEKRSDSDK